MSEREKAASLASLEAAARADARTALALPPAPPSWQSDLVF